MTDLQNDIDKYLRGELPAAEMHALEKKALDDPFLADALDGAAFLGPDEFSEDLRQLSEQLQERLEPPQKSHVFWIWTTRIAAGFLLLALATFLINLLITSRQARLDALASYDPALAGVPATQDTLDIYLPPAYERTSGNVQAIAAAGNRQQRGTWAVAEAGFTSPQHERTVEANLTSPESVRYGYTPGHAVPEVSAVAIEEAKDEPLKQAEAATPQQALEGKVAGLEIAAADSFDDKQKAAMPGALQVARGRVTASEDGSALPGINVVVKGSTTGTITDAEGYFEIPVTENNTTLQLAFVGLQNQEIQVSPGADIAVAMNADVTALSEVVVVGHARQNATPALEPATPDGGRKAFEEYIEQSLKYPDQALEHNIEGRVTVEFTVEPSGQLSDFKIVKGIGYGCDEEAIRLIKQGPKWIPTRKTTEPVRDHVKVKLKFALPRKK